LAADLLKNFEPEIDSITLVPSDGGRFEVSVNGKLIYSKLRTGRHAMQDEVTGLVSKLLKEGT
jgi:selenoprotein W-related protein